MNVFLIFSITIFASSWALVLAGGGARGAYEAGALKAIEEMKLDIKGVYGTSVGAVNGAFFVQGAVDSLYSIWKDLSYSNVMAIPSTVSTDSSYFYLQMLFHAIGNGGLSVKPFKTLVKSYLDEKKVRDSGIDFGLVTVDLSNFSPIQIYINQIPEGALLDYLMASANYPLFQRWSINGSDYIDGGLYNNAPVDMALKKGFKKILLINISDIPISIPPIPKGVVLKVITPSAPMGQAMDFDPAKERIWEKMGYLDTLRAFGKFVGKDYYIKPYEKPLLIDTLLGMSRSGLSAVADDLGVKIAGYEKSFAVYEAIIPAFLKKFRVGDFISLNTSLLENAASYLGIERMKEYTQRSLAETIAAAEFKAIQPSLMLFSDGDKRIVRAIVAICRSINGAGDG